MRSTKLFKTVASFTLVAAMVAPLLLTPASTADAAMKFNTKKASLTVGQTKKVKIKGFKKGSSAKWSSSSSKVASIKGKGKKATIKAVAPGTAKISCKVGTATIGGLTVKVRQKVTSFTITGAKDLKAGETLTLTAKINKGDAASKTNQTVSWSSSSSKVATVKKTGSTGAKVTAVSEGDATITAKSDGKTATCKIKVSGKSSGGSSNNSSTSNSKTNKKPTPTPWTYSDPKTIYKQHYDVTRWYNPDTTGAINGHKHDGYKNNTFAIWMVGFFDNPYSTNEDDINTTYGPELDKFKGKELRISGDFSYDGTNQKTILFQINYTSPQDYPILYKWEKGSNGLDTKYSNNLKIKDNTGGSSGALDAKKNAKLDINFTIPTNAVNGDKDDATGKNYGIYVYFPNKPGGALAYVKDNTFHFKNFHIRQNN